MMRKNLGIACSVLIVLLLATGPLAGAKDAQCRNESEEARDERMEWWREARFGMFVHWGLYSGLAGTWKGKPVGSRGGMEWIQQRVGASTEAYAEAAIPRFKPDPDFAAEWAELARKAGARYVVFTTKHHDGFALHRSDSGDFNAGAVLDRDLVAEIVTALRDEGLRVGFYHSVIDWHHDQYEYARSKHLPHPLRGKPYPEGERDHAQYQQHLHRQVKELMTGYGPVDVIWWDYSALDFQGDEAWRAPELMSMVRKHQPAIISNNRLYRKPEAGYKSMGTSGFHMDLDPQYGDFITPEQHIPNTGAPGLDWEVCMTMNTTWGYSDHDHAWKSESDLIRKLVEIASKGGNFLLNIGPKGDGSIPEASVRIMNAIGEWMDVNEESIRGTTASPFGQVPFGRVTAELDKNTLYLHVFDWPSEKGYIELPGIGNKVKSARPLAGSSSRGSALKTECIEDGLVRIYLPEDAPSPHVSVIKLELIP